MKNHKRLMHLSYFLKRRKDIQLYYKFKKEYYTPIEVLEAEQLNNFKILFDYSKDNIPYYRELFNDLKLKSDDFNSIEDLSKIPVLTKREIISNYEKFIPINKIFRSVTRSTGGSTGEPLKFRMSIEDYSRAYALLYRGFSKAGYNIGDKMAIIAGGSLVNDDSGIKNKIQDYILNFKKLSSYGINEEALNDYFDKLYKWKPLFLRGYASSLFLFAKFVMANKKPPLELKGVFSTAEMLNDNQRDCIERAFNTKVFNNYGLNDGGVSAFEDEKQDGFIIDTERSIMEVVNNAGKNIFNDNGKIIATSLYNFSMPFIRYETGDFGAQIKSKGEQYSRHRLVNLGGRTTDYISFNNMVIGSPVLTVLMGKLDILKYQIIQKKNNKIQFRIEPGNSYTEEDENYIRRSFKDNLGDNSCIEFIYTEEFLYSENKHKFIIKEK
ncbi:phenylacetate--CoA ligase family protein [Sinomicrobium sp. M5D2P17]